MDFELSQEQRMFQRAVRDFCAGELKPYAAEVDHRGEMRWEAIQKMPALGLTGLFVPEEYGGMGGDTVMASIAVEELGRVCGSTALSISAHNGLCCAPLVKWGTKAQKEKYLPALTSGKHLGALALTEPNAGSDLANARTHAVKDGDSWVINGAKAWITNPIFAPVIITFTRTDKDAGTRGFSMLLVEPGMAGLTLHTPEKKMGLKGSPTQMLSYDNVRVSHSDHLLGTEGRGFQQVMETLDAGRISIGALSVGLAQGAFEEGVKYAKQRLAFGQPIAQHQAIQFMIADAGLEIDAARLLVMRAAWLKDQGKPFTKEAAMAKLYASEVAERVCFNAIQIHGSYGYSAEFPVERMYRDQRLMSIGEGTSQIQRMVIARRLLAEM
ncbi:MAG TPA: acyl-CoA dehydrogenase family protein [Aggregatilineales bacterium]|nr:acyl-CoA dehydrogenase family protein [Anaerolineales bacterium]HRE49342.1 acyl-CoA dehydrogenase family protein [Aggregatilineales bacterium]